MQVVHVRDIDYATCFAWQNQLHERRVADEIGDVLLCVTHPPVYTAGRHAELEKNLTGTRPDIPVVPIDRGGDITYHGPGQVVAYPIMKLPMRGGAKHHVGCLEAAMISTAAEYGVHAHLRDGYPGVWVGTNKIGAVGVRISQGVSKHGLAFNVQPNLEDFTGIIPCGITDGGVTSLTVELQKQPSPRTIDFEQVARYIVDYLVTALERKAVAACLTDLDLV